MIVTLRLAEEKIKESQVEKGGIPPRLCGLVGSLSGASMLASAEPGRLRQIAARQSVAPLHLVAHTHEHTISRAKLSTGYPQCCTNTTTFII